MNDMEGGELEIIKKEKYEGELKKIQYQEGEMWRWVEEIQYQKGEIWRCIEKNIHIMKAKYKGVAKKI